MVLKNSKELLEHLKSKVISKVSSIKTFVTLYTIPHKQLKSRLSGLISSLISKWFTKIHVVVKYNTAYFVQGESDSPNYYLETDIIRMIEFLIDNISFE